jgi:hypothetical protein
MRSLFQQHPAAFVLALLCVLLGAVIALEVGIAAFQGDGGAVPAPTKTASAEARLLPPLGAVNPDDTYPETGARPLFTPTRRPAPPAVVAPVSTMVRGQFTLQGVIALKDQRIALLREKSTGRVHRVEVGQEVNGIKLAGADNDKVTLMQGAEAEQILLHVQKGTTPVPAIPPGPLPSTGPFAPQPAAAAAPTAPKPGDPVAVPPPPPPQPVPQPNPATRSGFGPYPPAAQPGQATADQQLPTLTPEELLARRRARREQSQNPRGQQ